jgi:NADH-quinone oxidoreductase subunit J
MYLVLFFIFAILCVGGALNLLLQKHPINSALSLIVVMISLAVLYLLLGAEFPAVYSGAIMVLFTFVIMLLNAGEEDRSRSLSKAATAAGFPGVVALICLLSYIFISQKTQLGVARLSDQVTSTSMLAQVLFRNLLLPFEVTSVLILIAILGAVALARKENR